VTVERYPDIKANQNFLQLQSQLEGTENRINVARDRYNEAVADYNTYIRVFPNNMFAGLFGFDRMERFQADAGAETAPDVEFDFN
jgi:LemA protein